jgi:hypothetical protein
MYKRYLSLINVIIVKLFCSSPLKKKLRFKGYKFPLNYLGQRFKTLHLKDIYISNTRITLFLEFKAYLLLFFSIRLPILPSKGPQTPKKKLFVGIQRHLSRDNFLYFGEKESFEWIFD